MTAADRLAEIEARIEAATEGPWEANSCDVETVPPFDLHRFDAMGLTVARCVQDVTDAAFIAHARTDLPATVAALRAVLELAYMNAVGSEYEHNEGCDGEAECPACWAADIRRAISEALGGAE